MVSMELVTPGGGTLELSRAEDPWLFRMARVGLGALGIISEVTLQLVPAHQLLEHTFIMSSKVGAGCACMPEGRASHACQHQQRANKHRALRLYG